MKILIISNNALSKTQCNGKTLRSFFSGFGADNIAQLYFGNNEYPDVDVCNRYYRITESQILKSIVGLKFSTSNSHKSLIVSRDSNNYHESSIVKYLKKYSSKLGIFRELLWKCGTWDTDELDIWIRKFNPDIIFALLGNNIYVHKIAQTLSQRYKLPLAVYFTDDYVINSTAEGLFERIHYRLLCKEYVRTLSNASLAYVIGEKMSKDYSAMYNREFGLLGNCIEFERFKHLSPIKIDKTKPIVISFIGGLHSNRWKSVAEMGRFIQKVNAIDNLNIQLKVFTVETLDNTIRKAFEEVGVLSCGPLTNEGVILQIEQSHFLLHVESFDEKYRNYVKYSISTKISECLVSNRVILAYGPHEVASISLISDNNFGCCITDLDDEKEILSKLRSIINEYNSYNFSNQYQFALTHYNQAITYKQLRSDFTKLLNLSVSNKSDLI